ncbi:MAG: radical SAM protein, partial [Candidatus Methanosuratincola petrocarbonis]
MSDYGGGLFYGFITTAPAGSIKLLPLSGALKFILHRVPADERGRALIAPHGLRRAEAALIESGVVGADDVAVVPPESLGNAITGDTKVIGISVIDPLGKGPASTTFSGEHGIVHAEAFSAMMFRRLMGSKAIKEAKSKGAMVVVGGPGTWQLEGVGFSKLNIDVLVHGEAETVFPLVVEKILGHELVAPAVFRSKPNLAVDGSKIPLLRGGTVGGLVEISRGCGRGCSFCLPNMRKVRHRAIGDIIEDVKTNLRFGQRSICLHAEDVLRYGTSDLVPRHGKVVELFTEVSKLKEISGLSISHAALASIATSPETVSSISEILGLGGRRWMGFQTGIETGSPELLGKLMRNKAAPFGPEEWPEVVERAFATCNDNGWVPAATLIINLPGESPEDIIKTTELVERLRCYRSLIVPLLCVPVTGKGKTMRLVEDAEDYHFDLYQAVWRHDLRWLKDIATDYTRGNTPP